MAGRTTPNRRPRPWRAARSSVRTAGKSATRTRARGASARWTAGSVAPMTKAVRPWVRQTATRETARPRWTRQASMPWCHSNDGRAIRPLRASGSRLRKEKAFRGTTPLLSLSLSRDGPRRSPVPFFLCAPPSHDAVSLACAIRAARCIPGRTALPNPKPDRRDGARQCDPRCFRRFSARTYPWACAPRPKRNARAARVRRGAIDARIARRASSARRCAVRWRDTRGVACVGCVRAPLALIRKERGKRSAASCQSPWLPGSAWRISPQCDFYSISPSLFIKGAYYLNFVRFSSFPDLRGEREEGGRGKGEGKGERPPPSHCAR